MYWLSGLSLVVFWSLISWFVVRTWTRWCQSEVRLPPPRWRSRFAVVGFAASNLSLGTIMFLMFSGFISSRNFLDRPPGFFALRIAFFSALAGICAAIAGSGPLGLPTAVCSIGVFLVLGVGWLGR